MRKVGQRVWPPAEHQWGSKNEKKRVWSVCQRNVTKPALAVGDRLRGQSVCSKRLWEWRHRLYTADLLAKDLFSPRSLCWLIVFLIYCLFAGDAWDTRNKVRYCEGDASAGRTLKVSLVVFHIWSCSSCRIMSPAFSESVSALLCQAQTKNVFLSRE